MAGAIVAVPSDISTASSRRAKTLTRGQSVVAPFAIALKRRRVEGPKLSSATKCEPGRALCCRQRLGGAPGCRGFYGVSLRAFRPKASFPFPPLPAGFRFVGAEWFADAALAMEQWPARSRGLMSGILQGSWGLGFLLSSAVYGLFYDHLAPARNP